MPMIDGWSKTLQEFVQSYNYNMLEYSIIYVVSDCKLCMCRHPLSVLPQRIERKEEVILAFRRLTLRGQVLCWMHSVCLCWHKLSAGWLVSGRLPAVTSTMRVRWLYCECATPLCIPPHIPKHTLRWRIDARGGLECPPGCSPSLADRLISAASLPLFLNFFNFSSSQPICCIFWRQLLHLFT